MVIEIALGIVLAVLILTFWRELVGLGCLVLVGAACLVLIAAAVWLIYLYRNDIAADPGILIILGIVAAAIALKVILDRRGQKEKDEGRRKLGYDE